MRHSLTDVKLSSSNVKALEEMEKKKTAETTKMQKTLEEGKKLNVKALEKLQKEHKREITEIEKKKR